MKYPLDKPMKIMVTYSGNIYDIVFTKFNETRSSYVLKYVCESEGTAGETRYREHEIDSYVENGSWKFLMNPLPVYTVEPLDEDLFTL